MKFSDLIGKTLTKCEGVIHGESILFETTEGKRYVLEHNQDCCESVTVEDICGELSDLVGSPIVQAEENSNSDPVPYGCSESWTWTFYRIATAKGQVVIRWLGESNGFYSEGVDFSEVSI